MKKKIFTCLLFIFLLSGCSQIKTMSYLDVNNVFINLNKVTYKSGKKTYPAFTKLILEDEKTIKQVYKLDTSLMEAYMIYAPILDDEANMCMLLKPKKENKKQVKEQADAFFKRYEEYWKKKDKTQYNMVKDRAYLEKEGYLFYVISRNNVDAIDMIENSFEEIELPNEE